MIKTIKYSYNKISSPYKRFLEGVLGVVIVLGVVLGLSTNKALASNNYIDAIQYYRDSNGVPILQFHVKTTFTLSTGSFVYPGIYGQNIGFVALPVPQLRDSHHNAFFMIPDDYTDYHISPNTTFTFQAGSIYKLIASFDGAIWVNSSGNACIKEGACYYNGQPWIYTLNPSSGDYLQLYIDGLFNDPDYYYFTEYPSLNITYPHDNDTIAGAFTIQGSYTVPSNGYYDTLEALLSYQAQSGAIGGVRFYQKLSTSSGEVNIPIDGIPANYYVLGFIFLNYHDCFEIGDCGGGYSPELLIHLNIVKDIPPALPSGETPPVAPIYNPLDPIQWYQSHSSDTPSDLYLTLTNTFSPLITNLGSNLVAFAGQFTGSQAQAISDNVSNAIITIKSYANNLNSFFNGLPVIQLLTGYILVFLAITIFRLAKGIIGLFKI